MQISYFLGSSNNPLYGGDFRRGKSFMTFGQHSFLYDLLLALIDRKIDVKVYVDDVEAFPLKRKLEGHGISCKLLQIHNIYSSDIIILDSLPDKFLKCFFDGYKFGIIHNYMLPCSEDFYNAADSLICMTPMAIKKQQMFYSSNKYRLIKQGIYLPRFTYCQPIKKSPQNVLFYSRMDDSKGKCYKELVEQFLGLGMSVSMLGAGNLFEYYKTLFNKSVSFLNHVPCYQIDNIISQYDIIVSNGRGVMEGLASNIPSIAAGVRYRGLITNDNFDINRDANFTGGYLPEVDIDIEKDIKKIKDCFDSNPFYFRNLATKYLDVDEFVQSLINTLIYVSSR